MLMQSGYAEGHKRANYAECCYAECHNAECYAECHSKAVKLFYAECHYAPVIP